MFVRFLVLTFRLKLETNNAPADVWILSSLPVCISCMPVYILAKKITDKIYILCHTQQIAATGTLKSCLSLALQPFVGPRPLFSFLIFYTVGRTPWTGDQPSQGRYLHTGQYKHNKRTQTSMPCGIRTHDPSVRAGEDSSCLRPRGHCDRPKVI
jgi:hypothetical protein